MGLFAKIFDFAIKIVSSNKNRQLLQTKQSKRVGGKFRCLSLDDKKENDNYKKPREIKQ